MLFRNDVFELDGIRMRLLHADIPGNLAWCISLDSPVAWPMCLPYAEIADLASVISEEVLHKAPSDSCARKCNEAWSRLEPLLSRHGANLFDPRLRNAAVLEYAQECNCSPKTLRKDLRRYWQRGQSKLALLPDYVNSGRPQVVAEDGSTQVTAGRGRKPRAGHPIYQVESADIERMRKVVETKYLKDSRITLVDAYTDLVGQYYTFEDGNFKRFANPPGERPSLRQFKRFVLKNYDIETRLRGRKGDSDYEREDRKVLGTVLADCLGVGHYYEIDATIADIYLVSHADSTKIIGKPTLYLIIDRKSRLIVGFYFGLENASWNAALQAILSISEDKRSLCQRYGVEYDPRDWPAHQVFPQQFLGDRADMISFASTSISEGIQVIVTNVPSKRPDWKPLVECGFRMVHNTLRPETPAYDPPSNATRRRGKHYEKDACLTVNDFGNLLLSAIIAHNRREMLNYDLTPGELLAGVRPSPVELWNHGILTRAGLLTRFSAERIRFALLRKDTARVTEKGVEFRGCYYSFPEAIARKWFETARKSRFTVVVSYDPRLVDHIYVHDLEVKNEPRLATLTSRSEKYKGLCFEEVLYFEKLRQELRQESEHERLQNALEYRQRVAPVVADAKERLKKVGKTSRSGRRADTKAARNEELSIERRQMASLQTHLTRPSSESVLSETSGSTSDSTGAKNLLDAIRARMLA